MAKNILVINVDIRETRVALIENGIIAELHMERHGARGTLGNIYLGKVSRVLPGMQAAFIDIGQERAAFLHVEDLIRPDDFEAYLSGKRGRAAEEEGRPAAHDHEVPVEPAHDDHEHDEAPADAAAGDDAPAADEVAGAEAEAEAEAEDEAWVEEVAVAEDDGVEVEVEVEADDDASEVIAADADDDGEADLPQVEINDADLPRVEITDAEPLAARAADADDADAAEADADPDVDPTLAGTTPEDDAALRAPRARTRRGGRGRKRRGTTRPETAAGAAEPSAAPAAVAPSPRGQERGRGEPERRGRGPKSVRAQAPQKAPAPQKSGKPQGRLPRARQDGRRSTSRSSANDPLRVSKSTPIRDVVREGQEVVVQVSKEPIGTKGARVTSHISLPGRYVVYLPTVEHVGISKRIGSDKERSRLREAIEAMKPPQGGLIVRTLAEGLTKKSLKADVGYLVRLWGEIAKNRESAARAPASLYSELDLVLKTARDLFTDDIEKIVIDDKDEYLRLRRFVEMFMPERVAAIELYDGDEPIFDEYGIEEEIGRAISRKVPLTSGGHLIIDQAEALTAIDVNTGRFVGKGSKDLEDTILQTNMEAVEEIAYQLRFRNIGGLIILDLIDMERLSNREKVRRRLEQLLAKDKAKTTLNRISDLGLIEMTRKRTRESLGRFMNEPCFYCDGTGNLQSRQTIAYEILRQIKRDRANLRGYSVVINAHPAVIDFLKNEERGAVVEAERRYTRRIELVARKEYHLEQFDLVGK